jgi:hypothetical protein
MWYGVLVLLGSLALAQEAALSVRGHEDPLQREEAFRYQRAFPFEQIPEGARLRALQQLQRMEQALGRAQLLSSQPRWRAIGPFTVGGRIRTVVHHPQREGWVYIGAAAGGIWRTTDGDGAGSRSSTRGIRSPSVPWQSTPTIPTCCTQQRAR